MLLSHLGNNGCLSQKYEVNVFADHTRRLKRCILIHPKAACVGASRPIHTLDFLGPFLSPDFKIFKLTWLYIRDIVEEILSANSTRYLYFLTTPQVWRSSGHNALTLHHLQKHTKIYTYCMKIFVTNSDMRHSAVVAISTAIVTRTAPQKLNLALLNILKTCIQTLPYARFYSNSVRWLRSC